jgi:hypothetical protein
MISSKTNPDLLIFNWKDPQEDETGWKELKLSSIGLADCFSVGWVINETNDYYVLAADIIIDKGRITDTGRRQSIYKSRLNIFKRIDFNIYEAKMGAFQTH